MDRPPRELLTLWPKIFRSSRYATLYRNNNFEIPQDCLFFLQNKINNTRIFFKIKITKSRIFSRLSIVNQWLQIDVGPPTLITGVMTKGRGDSKKKHWVTRFKISYSNDTQRWYQYKDAHSVDPRVSPPTHCVVMLYMCSHVSSELWGCWILWTCRCLLWIFITQKLRYKLLSRCYKNPWQKSSREILVLFLLHMFLRMLWCYMEFQAVSNGATRRRVIRYNTCTYASDFKFWLCLWFWFFTAFVNILPPFGVNICSPSPLCIPLALWEKLTFYICIHVFYNSPFRFQKIHAVYCCMKTLTWSNFTSVKLCFASIYNTKKVQYFNAKEVSDATCA